MFATTAFGHGYILAPLRGCSGSNRFPESSDFPAPDQEF